MKAMCEPGHPSASCPLASCRRSKSAPSEEFSNIPPNGMRTLPLHDDQAAQTILVAHPSSELYGSDRMLLESVGALSTSGWRVVSVLPAPGPLVEPISRLGSAVLFQPSPVLRKASLSPSGMLRLVRSLGTLPSLLRLLRREAPDVVYVNTLTLPLWLLAARLVRTPVLCHVHEAEEGLSRLVRWGLAAPLLLATRIVAISRATETVLAASIRRLRTRTEVINNGVRGPEQPSAPRAALAGRIRLLVVGRISPRKGTDRAIAATKRLCEEGYNVGLEIVGNTFAGYEWFEELVREQAAAPVLAGRVSFTGFVDDVWAAYDRSDIALVPSVSEPFGNVAVEGMLARRPVVAAAVQGLTEIIDDGITGVLVESGNGDGFAAAVRQLCDDWPSACSIAEAGRARAVEAFSTDRYAREIVNAVEATAAVHGRRS